MVTLSAILPIMPSTDAFLEFIVECSNRWPQDSHPRHFEKDVREIIEIYFGPPSREYLPEELAEMAETMKFIPQGLVVVSGVSLPGSRETALWFADCVIARWGGFIDDNGEGIYQIGWIRK